MDEVPILPWIAVNEHLEAPYRDLLVRIALQHLPKASKDLQVLARQEFNAISIHGFRSFDRADEHAARPYVVSEMIKRPGVATAVIFD